MERQLETAIEINNKSHVHIDGLYFMDFGNRGWQGIINCVDSDNITITRCFDNGRGRGYSPAFVNAERVDSLTIRNCVLTNGMAGITVRGCPMRNAARSSSTATNSMRPRWNSIPCRLFMPTTISRADPREQCEMAYRRSCRAVTIGGGGIGIEAP